MRLPLSLVLTTLAVLAFPAEARQGDNTGGSVREACREEARQSINRSRTSPVDREQIKEMRRQYARDCRRKAKAA